MAEQPLWQVSNLLRVHAQSECFATSADRQEGHVGFLPIALNFFPQVLQIYVTNQLVSIVTTGPPPEHMILSPYLKGSPSQ
jgi:hypothetical protein